MSRCNTIIPLVIVFAALCSSATMGAPSVSNVSANASSVGTYDKYELTFNVSTAATNSYWPYDTSPNQGVPSGVGVSVDGLFSNDNWATTIVQPAFYFQDYDRNNYLYSWLKRDWLYPKGTPIWKIRFAPALPGTWKYKIRVTDSSGTYTYDTPSNTFTCTSSSNRGFVRVSSSDPRYFETSDGSYLNMIGLSDYVTCTYDVDSLYATYKANGINLLRPWWQGSQGPILFGMSGQGGVPNWRNLWLTTEAAKPGEMFSGKIVGSNTISTSVDVKPSTKYKYSVWVKTVGLTGSGDYGAYLQAFDCTQPDTPLTSKVRGDTNWTQLTASITTKSGQYVIDFLKIVVSGASAGTTYITDVSLKEDLGNGQYGPELVSRPNFDAYQNIAQREAWLADYQVDSAKRNNVYLKVCLEEKADEIFGDIQANGTPGTHSDDNVYATDTHACRTYQKYFWRYITARYGYATSIHSWELMNEGDPFYPNHHNAVEALAKYIKQTDPNKHLVTTSLWHSFPSKELWSNPSYPDVDYADWHQYIGLQNGNNLQYIYGWQQIDLVITNAVSRSAPNSLYINNSAGNEAVVNSYPFAITPGHAYTIKCNIKGQSLTTSGTKAGDVSWVQPTVKIIFKDGWAASEVSSAYPTTGTTFMGTYDWKQFSATVTAPASARYLVLAPAAHWAVGQIWFDDITLHDDTANEDITVPNGDFDSNRIDFDTALANYSIGTQVGAKSSRVVQKPVIRGELGISGDKVFADPYKGVAFTGENQQLVDDTQGVWLRKLVWGAINPFGIIDMYWWRDNITKNNLYKYSKSYQAFMTGIQLDNGNYTDAKTMSSNLKLRAWGQKDLVANKAHLWIDNIDSNWKNVVDGKTISPASGTITVTGFKAGAYKAEWWDTTTGTVTRIDDISCVNSSIILPINSLQSDLACKICPSTAPVAPANITMQIKTPSATVVSGDIVTVTIEYINSGDTDASSVAVVAKVPAEMDYVTGSAEATGGTWNSQTNSVTWNVGTVTAHTTGTRTYKAKVK